jgi:hypothetical protein
LKLSTNTGAKIDFELIPDNILYGENSNELQKLIIENNGELFSCINNPSEFIIYLGIRADRYNIFYVKDKCEKYIKCAIKHHPALIMYFSNYLEYAIGEHGNGIIRYLQTIDDLLFCFGVLNIEREQFLEYITDSLLHYRFWLLSATQLDSSKN